MPLDKMRSGLKLLSRSTRRQLVRRRPVPRFNQLELQVPRSYLVVGETSFDQFHRFSTTTHTRQITPSMRRCFATKSPDDGDFERTENDVQDAGSLEELDFGHGLDGDFDSEIFHDENAGERDKDRIWMDPETPLEQRVDRFVNQPLGSIHHLDIKLTSLDLMKECGKLKSFEGMKRAQEILDRLIEEKNYVNNSDETTTIVIVPDRPFKIVMYGWANLCRKVKFAPQRMREVLDLMIQEAEYDKKMRETVAESRIQEEEESGRDDDDNTNDDDFAGLSCEPTVDIYNTLLQGLLEAATRSIQAAIEAEHALSKMDKMHRSRGWHTKPNTRSYSLVLNAYANSKHATAGERAEAVLRDMMERHEYEKEDYFEEYGIEYNTVDDELNERKIVTPDTIAYTMVIQAHGSSDSAASAEKALMLLHELIESPNHQVDSFCFANTINAFSKMAARKKNPLHRFQAAERAEDILWIMVEELKNNPDWKGSIVPFNACLNAWAQSFTAESPYRAEELLHKMLDPELQSITQVRPNTVSFNTCMQAWSKACKLENSAEPRKAEELLELLVTLSEDEDNIDWNLKPDIRSYATVMNAYALSQNSDSVVQTRRLLMDLIQNGRGNYFETSGKDRMNAHPFTIVLKAAANTKNDDNKSEAESNDLGFGAAQVDISEDPYTIALDTYSDLLNDNFELGVRPDHFAFAEMLAVVAKYTDSESIERRQRIEEVFGDACSAGQVSSLVVKAMQSACPNDIVLADMLRLRGTAASIESINMFPRQWTSRVPQEFRRVSSRKDHFQKQSKYFRGKTENRKQHTNKKGKRRNAKKN